MRTAYALLTLLLTVALHAAVPIGAVRINTDTTGTNTHSSAITVSGQTNLYSGTLNATNSVNVGLGSTAPGVLVLLSTNGTYTVVATVTSAGALSVNASNTLSSGNLLTAANNSTNILALGAKGGLWIGRDAFNQWPTKDFVIEQNQQLGDDNPLQVYWETIDSGDYNQNAGLYCFFTSASNNVTSTLALQAVDTGTSPVTVLAQLQAAFDDLSLTLSKDATTRLKLKPDAADGTTAHVLDTTLAHSTGNLLEVNNHSTNFVQVPVDLAATNAPLTLNINGTQKRVHVGAADSGGTGLRALTIEN